MRVDARALSTDPTPVRSAAFPNLNMVPSQTKERIAVKFTATAEEYFIIHKISIRAQAYYKEIHGETLDLQSMEMDLEAVHCNDCPMDFKKLLAADNFNLMHDVIGIINCIDRDTGKLTRCFLPRCSL